MRTQMVMALFASCEAHTVAHRNLQQNGGIFDIFNNLHDQVKDFFDNNDLLEDLHDNVRDVFGSSNDRDLNDVVDNIEDKIRDFFGNDTNLPDIVDKVKDKIGSVFDDGSSIGDLLDEISEKVDEAFGNNTALGDLAESIKEKIDAVFGNDTDVRSILEDIREKLSDAVSDIQDSDLVANITDFLGDLADAAGNGTDNIMDGLKPLWEKVRDFVSNIGDSIEDSTSDLFNPILDEVEEAMRSACESDFGEGIDILADHCCDRFDLRCQKDDVKEGNDNDDIKEGKDDSTTAEQETAEQNQRDLDSEARKKTNSQRKNMIVYLVVAVLVCIIACSTCVCCFLYAKNRDARDNRSSMGFSSEGRLSQRSLESSGSLGKRGTHARRSRNA